MELSPDQWGMIALVIILVILVFAHFFFPFSMFPKEDPLDERIAHDLPELSGPDDATIAEVMRTGQPVIRSL